MGHQKKKKTQALKAAAASVKKRRDAQIKRGPRRAPDKPWNFEKLTRPATKRIEVDETALRQRNSPVKAKSDESGCAATNVNANEKTLKRIERLWSAVACVREARARSKTGKVKKEIMVTIAENHRLSASHLYWVVRRSQSWSLRRRAGSGRPRTATKPEKLEWLTHKNNETNGMLSLRELGAAMKAQNPNKPVGSKTAVQRAWKELGYRHVRVRTLPRLEDKHVHDRLAWATERAGAEQPFGDDETIHIHVDEKWFYVVRIGQLQWRGQHEHLRPIHIIHRSHVVKEMFLAAVARPIRRMGSRETLGCGQSPKRKQHNAKASITTEGTNTRHQQQWTPKSSRRCSVLLSCQWHWKRDAAGQRRLYCRWTTPAGMEVEMATSTAQQSLHSIHGSHQTNRSLYLRGEMQICPRLYSKLSQHVHLI